TLVTYAAEMGVVLIVMTTHGRGGISRAWLGSDADTLVRRTAVPVLLLRPREEEVEFECEPHMQHLLIPLDGSELSEGTLSPALAIAQLSHARVTLLQVVQAENVTPEEAEVERVSGLRYLETIARDLL